MKNYKKQTRNILRWERKQAWGNILKGLPLGIIIGAIAVLAGFFVGHFL